MTDAATSGRPQQLFLVHHGEALSELVDPQRPLSAHGRAMVTRLAEQAAARGVRPSIIWHSGKLRARDTAEAFWKACNALAELRALRGLQPSDGPWWLRDQLIGETRDVMVVGHMPHLPRALGILTTGDDEARVEFPLHGLVALERVEGTNLWRETWRLATGD
jgi:phosphohistidine phosphatase